MPGSLYRILYQEHCSINLPHGGMEVPCTLPFIGQTQCIKKLQKLVASAPAKNVKPPPPKKEKADAIVIIDDEVEVVEQTNPQ